MWTIQLRRWSIRSLLFTSGLIYGDQDIPQPRALQTPRFEAIRRLNCDAHSCQRRQRDEENIPMGLTFKILREPRSKLLASLTRRCHNAVPCKSATSIISYMFSNDHQTQHQCRFLQGQSSRFLWPRERWEMNVHYEKASPFARYEHDVYSRDGPGNWTNTWPSVGFRLAISEQKDDDRRSIFSFPRLALEVSVTNKCRASSSIPNL